MLPRVRHASRRARPGVARARRARCHAAALALRARSAQPYSAFGLLELGGIGLRRVCIRRRDHDAAGQLRCNGERPSSSARHRTRCWLCMPDGQVSFEVDHLDQALRAGWSVLVHGRAHEVAGEREVKRLEDRNAPRTVGRAAARDVYVRIAPTRISGRCDRGKLGQPPGARHRSLKVGHDLAVESSPGSVSASRIAHGRAAGRSDIASACQRRTCHASLPSRRSRFLASATRGRGLAPSLSASAAHRPDPATAEFLLILHRGSDGGHTHIPH